MITLLSPAKTLNFKPADLQEFTLPRLQYDTNRLATALKKKSARSLGKLMSINESLAKLNAERYSSYSEEFNQENSKQSILAFDGDVYRGLAANDLSIKDLSFSQEHLRILSGFYGLLRPLDRIQAYRLEMGTNLRTSRGKNLYKFWKNRVSDLLEQDIQEQDAKVIINLASNEYFKAIRPDRLSVPIYTIQFKEYRNDKLTFVSFNAKKARGMMARYIIDHRMNKPEDLKSFDIESYEFAADLSTESEYLFIR